MKKDTVIATAIVSLLVVFLVLYTLASINHINAANSVVPFSHSHFYYPERATSFEDSIAIHSLQKSNSGLLTFSCSYLEETRGADSTARLICQIKRFPYEEMCRCGSYKGWINELKVWQNNISCVEQSISSELYKALKKVVIERNNDPVWMGRYLSVDKMIKLSPGIEGKRVAVYATSLDSLNQQRVLKELPDHIIISYKFGSKIPIERAMKIAEEIGNIESAYYFLNYSDANPEYKRCFLLKHIKEINCSDLLWYYAEKYFEYDEVLGMLKNKSTKQLVTDTHIESDHFWSFGYGKYATIVINSVKTSADYDRAADFLIETNETPRIVESWLNDLYEKKKCVGYKVQLLYNYIPGEEYSGKTTIKIP